MLANRVQFLAALAVLWLFPTGASAVDFRIESHVFADGGKEPVTETLTLFSAGLVYDFTLTEPKEIVIFDPQREQFVLLDVGRQVKLSMSKEQILQFTAALKAAPTMQGRDPLFFEPKFEKALDMDAGSLTMSNARMTYRAKGSQPADSAAVGQFRQFADWYCRLNATKPGTMPPFARLALNEAIADEGFIPDVVELTIFPTNRLFQKKIEVKSQHYVVWQLSTQDGARIEKANYYRGSFESVGFKEYRELTETASRAGANR